MSYYRYFQLVCVKNGFPRNTNNVIKNYSLGLESAGAIKIIDPRSLDMGNMGESQP